MGMFQVDVVVPCYRYGHYLRECVHSALSQTGVHVRLLILNDASPDNTAAVADALAAEDPRVSVIHHATNRGHLATFNEGLAWAGGDAVLMLSADDLLLPGSLARAARVFSRHPKVGFVYGQAITLRNDQPAPNGELSFLDDSRYQVLAGRDFLRACCQTACNPVSTPTAIVRTTVQKRIGGYSPELRHTSDMEMWMRAAVHADVAVVNTYQACYRWHGGNMQLGYLRPVLGDLPERRKAFWVLFRDQRKFLADADELEELANRRMAEEALWLAGRAFDDGQDDCVQQCLDFAADVYPPVRTWKSWKRFRLKRFMGRRVWSLLRPMVEGLRRAVLAGRGQ